MALVQLTSPAVEPIDLATAKNFLRLDSGLTADDTLISIMIGAARRYAETYTRRSFVTQQWRRTLDGFSEAGFGAGGGFNVIELERGRVQTVDAIRYVDMAGTTQTVDLSTLVLDTSTEPARVMPRFSLIWPIPLPQINSVQIDYTAGYGASATDVPEGIRHWMLVRLATIYDHRQEVEVVSRGKVEAMPFIDTLLDPYKIETA